MILVTTVSLGFIKASLIDTVVAEAASEAEIKNSPINTTIIAVLFFRKAFSTFLYLLLV